MTTRTYEAPGPGTWELDTTHSRNLSPCIPENFSTTLRYVASKKEPSAMGFS